MPHELVNKPLVEAILELKWSPPGVVISWSDPAYPLFVGTLYEAVKQSYPFVEELPAKQMPDEITAGVVKYRFRRSQGGWPLLQAGPGVAAINFTDTYDWPSFRGAALDFSRSCSPHIDSEAHIKAQPSQPHCCGTSTRSNWETKPIN